MQPLPLVSFGDGGALFFVNITDSDEGAKGRYCQLSEFQRKKFKMYVRVVATRKYLALNFWERQFMTDPAFTSASTYPFPIPLAPSRS